MLELKLTFSNNNSFSNRNSLKFVTSIIEPCVVVAHECEVVLSTAESMVDIHDNVGWNMTRRGKKKRRMEAAEKGRNEKKGRERSEKASRGDGRVEPQVSRRTARPSIYLGLQVVSNSIFLAWEIPRFASQDACIDKTCHNLLLAINTIIKL